MNNDDGILSIIRKDKIDKFIKYIDKDNKIIHSYPFHNMTFLMYSCLYGCYNISKYLIEHNVDIHYKNEFGNNAILFASPNNDSRIFESR